MSNDQSTEATNSAVREESRYRTLRIWPLIFILTAMGATRFVPPLIENGPDWLWMVSAFGPILCCLLLVVWWLLVSRARWFERIVGVLGIVGGVYGALQICDKSMHGPATFGVIIPVGLAAFGVGLVLFSAMLSFKRTIIAVLFAYCAIGFSTLLRSEGMWGDYSLGLHWRWTPSSEEKLLATKLTATKPTASIENIPNVAKMISSPEWPGFRGPNHDAQQHGVKFSKNWEANPPELIWKTPVGPAWSSFVVAGDLLFTQEQRGKMEAVTCYSAVTGQELWIREIESRFDDPLGGPGPRATPTLVNSQLFAMGAQGFLLRLNPTNGEIIWQQDLRKVAGREPPIWGFSSSPLVAKDVVIVHAGGSGDKGILAFATETGDVKWSAPSGDHTYSSPELFQIEGESLVAMLTNKGLDLVAADSGETKLKYEYPIDGYRSLQPSFADGNLILLPSALGDGTRRIRVTKQGDAYSAEEVWSSRAIKPEFNDCVIYQDNIYGFDAAIFTCVSLETGERRWKGGRYGKGQVLLLEDSGLLLIASEEGDIVLVEADPAGHKEVAKFRALEGKTWNHPVVVGDKLYIRNAEQAACYRLPKLGPTQEL
jgi:outer membrane protein assembly factor BamB